MAESSRSGLLVSARRHPTVKLHAKNGWITAEAHDGTQVNIKVRKQFRQSAKTLAEGVGAVKFKHHTEVYVTLSADTQSDVKVTLSHMV